MENQEIHHYHHYDISKPGIDIEVAKNTKGYNYTVKVKDVRDENEATEAIQRISECLEVITNELVIKYQS